MNKTIFVIGVIALFIGFAFVPSFNAIPLSTSDDNIPLPIIEVTWETYKLDGTWYVDFNCSYGDNGSGIHRVAWYLNGLEQDIISGPGPYAFHLTVKLSIVKKSVFRFVAYYGIGFSAFVEIDGSDIKSLENCIECKSNNNPLAEKILNRLEKNEVLSNVINNNNPNKDRPICVTLWNNVIHYENLASYYEELAHQYPSNKYYKLMIVIYATVCLQIFSLYIFFGCWEVPEN